MNEWIIALISGLLGSIIGAGAGAGANYYFTKKHTLKLEKTQRLNLAKALESELASIWARYMDIAGRWVEETADMASPPRIGIPETVRNYFVVFDSSANLLGIFEQGVISKIIEAYINGKALVDELVEYGNLTTRYWDAYHKGGITNELNEEVRIFFLHFKERHFEIKNIFEEAMSVLNELSSSK